MSDDASAPRPAPLDEARGGVRPAVPGRHLSIDGRELEGAEAEAFLHECETLVARYTEVGLCVTDPVGRVEWVNDAFSQLTGFPAAQVVGRERIELVQPSLRASEVYRAFVAELQAGRVGHIEVPARHRDGTPLWLQWVVAPVLQEDRVVRLVWVEHDVTQRKKAEIKAQQALARAESLGQALRLEKRLLSAVLGAIPHAVWWKDRAERFMGANAAYLQLRGLGSVAEVIGRTEAELSADDDLGRELTEAEQVIAETGHPVHDRSVHVRVGERTSTYLVSTLPYVKDGEISGVIGVCTNISQITEMERQLAQTNRLESIGQLAAGIAHEINTPVQYVSDNTRFAAESFGEIITGLGELEGLAAVHDADELHRRIATALGAMDLEFIRAEIPSALSQSLEGLDRVATIVRAMKDFSHPGGSRAETDLNAIVESTVQVSRNEWKYIAELVCDLGEGVDAVPCFAGEIKQVLLNLVVNAAHTIDERRAAQGTEALGRITIRTWTEDGEARVAVSDDGRGMSPEVQRRMFDPFFTTKPVGKGTGQGLSLAHASIVTQHGGRIDVQSTEGVGTVLTVCLPLVLADATPADALGSGPGAGAGPDVGPDGGPVPGLVPDRADLDGLV